LPIPYKFAQRKQWVKEFFTRPTNPPRDGPDQTADGPDCSAIRHPANPAQAAQTTCSRTETGRFGGRIQRFSCPLPEVPKKPIVGVSPEIWIVATSP